MADRIHIDLAIRQLVELHGSLRAVGRATGIDATYLSRLAHGEKANPSDDTLARIGLRRVTYYTTIAKDSRK